MEAGCNAQASHEHCNLLLPGSLHDAMLMFIMSSAGVPCTDALLCQVLLCVTN